MLKKLHYLFILFFVVTLAVSATNKPVKIISIDLREQHSLDIIELLSFPVIDINDYEFVTVADKEKIALLNEKSIKYKEHSDFITGDDIYLFTAKNKQDIAEINLTDKKLYELGKNILAISNTVQNIEDERFRKIPINKINRTFKNVKTKYNNIQSDQLDALINSIVTDVDSNKVRGYIQGLQDFGTRFLRHPNRKEVALWIKEQFEIMGYTDVVLDSFNVSGYRQYNVVATYPALQPSDKYIIVGGHHDSITQQSLSNTAAPAPGADDNASGTTAVLESARVLMENNFESEVNVKFVTFAAEELGLYGGYDYARKAANSGMNVKLMINHDMISSNRRPISGSVVDINYYRDSDAFSQLAFQSVEKFTAINAEYGSSNSSGSDSYAFWSNGFNAVYFEESDFSSYYHTDEDLIENYDMTFCAEVIKASVATLIATSVAPSQVAEFTITDAGDGSSLYLEWEPNTESDLVNYKIFLGTEEGVFTNEFETSSTNYTIGDLTEGSLYYVGISAVDADGYESIITQRTKVPYQFPLAPAGVELEPVWHGVELNWEPNEELDLAGYNVYRSGIDTDDITKLNVDVLNETSFIDNTIESGIYYEYLVKAVDNDQNESINSEYLISRGVTLDNGILIVDETTDGDGSIYSPTDEEVDLFYENMLSDFNYTKIDLNIAAKIDLAELGAYNAILWYGDDKTDQNAIDYKDDIRKYLDFGGKFFYSGYRPSKTFEGVNGLSKTFTEGDFFYDCFKIAGVNYSILAKFDGAVSPSTEYSDLYLDESKIDANGDGHINGVEAFTLIDSTMKIYEYHSTYGSAVPQGSLNSGTVGAGYFGEDFSTVVLSFPLYYTGEAAARNFINNIFGSKFGLTTEIIPDENELPSSFSLEQNYPNPFNPSTRIKYSIKTQLAVSLRIYDILGREVKTLVNEVKQPGTYEVEFNASALASGIYFYSIKAGDFTATKKLMLIK